MWVKPLFYLRPLLTLDPAAVVGDMVYIDGGQFSYSDSGSIVYAYCEISWSLRLTSPPCVTLY